MTSKEALSHLVSGQFTWEHRMKCKEVIEKEHEDFEYLKSLFSIEWFDKLPTSDKIRVMKIMGMEIKHE